MNKDPEIIALSNVYDSLRGLTHTQVKRIIEWITSKFGLDEETSIRDVHTQNLEAEPPIPGKIEPVQPAAVPVKKKRGRPPGKIQPRTVSAGIKGFMKYDSLEELFFASNVKTIGSRILLAAAYLQEKENLKELSSYIVSSRLKNLGETVTNPSAAINNLMSKKPPLLLQTGRNADSKQSRRKFRVTEEGLRIARNYINENK